ncbi:MAG: murein biosynthesis integral membrane protein MurJ [Rhodospirillaceae bacterium]|nr:murein biosynthesis integral membrane protein MurJ [Rhodospirillaceae bacterium]
MAIIRSITTVGAMTLLSRVFGFIRDVAIAATLGAGGIADIFFVAFKLPNLFRRLFAEGAFNLAFVPIFATKLERDGKEPARTFASEALSALVLVIMIVVMVFEITMPWVITVFAPGFVNDPERFNTTVDLARITFPYLLFISLVSLLSGVLNSVGRFWAAAAAPILLNLTLIAAVLIGAPYFATPAHALSWGVFFAGIFQLAWLVFIARRAGWGLFLSKPRFNAEVKLLLKRMAPVALGAGVYQINLVIDTVIASLLPAGAISYLFYADRLHQLPVGVVGVAVGTALLPLLSRQISAGQNEAALASQNRALEFALLLTLPAAAALVIMPETILQVLFERGAFDHEATIKTASALAVFALGLPAYIFIKALAPGFFSRGDTATPIKIGVLCLVVNLVLNLLLMKPFQHVGIAAATVSASWVNAGLLAWVLMRRGHFSFDARFKKHLPRQLGATAIMALAIWALLLMVGEMFIGTIFMQASALVLVVILAAGVYGVAAIGMGVISLGELKSLVKKRT